MRRNGFTLVEIMVVVAIMVMATTVVMSRLRDGSPAVVFENSLRDFRNFIAQARGRANELGCDQLLLYDPAERRFRIAAGAASDGNDDGTAAWNSLAPPPDALNQHRSREYNELAGTASGGGLRELVWALPAGFEIDFGDTDYNASGDERTVFRFRAAGGGDGGEGFTLIYDEASSMAAAVSPVTGKLRFTETAEAKR